TGQRLQDAGNPRSRGTEDPSAATLDRRARLPLLCLPADLVSQASHQGRCLAGFSGRTTSRLTFERLPKRIDAGEAGLASGNTSAQDSSAEDRNVPDAHRGALGAGI